MHRVSTLDSGSSVPIRVRALTEVIALCSSVELLFGTHNKKSTVDKLFNYTILFMRRYIYTRKLNEDALLLPDFLNKIRYRYNLEKFPPE